MNSLSLQCLGQLRSLRSLRNGFSRTNDHLLLRRTYAKLKKPDGPLEPIPQASKTAKNSDLVTIRRVDPSKPRTYPPSSKSQAKDEELPTPPPFLQRTWDAIRMTFGGRSSVLPPPPKPPPNVLTNVSSRIRYAWHATFWDMLRTGSFYLLVLVPGFLLVHFFIDNVATIHTATGASMLPTIHVSGEWFITLPHFARGHGVKVGDIICARHPLKPGRWSVMKRIAGLPGDFVWVEHAQVMEGVVDPGSKAGRMVKVPVGHCWLSGDNAAFSRDSRHYGAVPCNLIIGKVVWRIFPLRRFGRVRNTLEDVEEEETVFAI